MPARPSADPADQLFRDEVARLRAAAGLRRFFPLGVHVGAPDGRRRSLELPWPVPREYDAGLRFDVADGLVEGLLTGWPEAEAVWGWVTRPGVPQVHDCDLGWLAALTRAVGAHGRPVAGFRAVTRTGWLDVASGESRTWKRLRG
jgi:hypothetical protein